MIQKTIQNTALPLLLFLGTYGFTQNEGEITVPLSDPGTIGSLEIHIKKGDITVSGSNRTDVLLKFSKLENTSENRAFEMKTEENTAQKIPTGMKRIVGSKIDLKVAEKDNIVRVENLGLQNPIKLEVEIPVHFNVSLKTYSSENLSISNVSGLVNVESDFGGAIKAQNITGSVNAITYSGDIEIHFVDIPEPMEMTFRNYSGKIDLALPPTYPSDLLLKTVQGEIFSSLDIRVDDTKNQLQTDDSADEFRAFTDSWTHATLNGGGKPIKIRSELGTIYLRSNQDP